MKHHAGSQTTAQVTLNRHLFVLFFLGLVVLVSGGCTSYGGRSTPVTNTQPDSQTTATALANSTAISYIPERGNLQRTGEYVHGGADAPQMNQVLWTTPYHQTINGGPIVSGETVVFSTNDGILHFLDKNNGKERWQAFTGGAEGFTVVDDVLYYKPSDGLYAVDAKTKKNIWVFPNVSKASSTPLVAAGAVYFGVGDGHYYALDAKSGKEKWSTMLTTGKYSTDFGNISCEPILSSDKLYVCAGSGDLYALDAATGKQKWKFKAGNFGVRRLVMWNNTLYFSAARYENPEETPTPDIYSRHPDDAHIYIGMYAVDMQSGQLKWKIDPASGANGVVEERGWSRLGEPIVYDGVVYSATTFVEEDQKGIVYAFDAASGKQLWKKVTKNELATSSLSSSDGLVYVIGIPPYLSFDDSPLYALDAKTGEEKWTFKAGAALMDPVMSNGILYTGSPRNQRGMLYALDVASGKTLHSIAVQGGVNSQLMLVDGTIYTMITDLDVPGDQIIAVK